MKISRKRQCELNSDEDDFPEMKKLKISTFEGSRPRIALKFKSNGGTIESSFITLHYNIEEPEGAEYGKEIEMPCLEPVQPFLPLPDCICEKESGKDNINDCYCQREMPMLEPYFMEWKFIFMLIKHELKQNIFNKLTLDCSRIM